MSNIVKTKDFEWQFHNFNKDLLKVNKYRRELCSTKFKINFAQNTTKWYFTALIYDGGFFIELHKKNVVVNDFTVKFEAFVRTSSNGIEFYRYNKQKARHFINWSLFLFKIEDVIARPENYLVDDGLTIVMKIQLTKTVQANRIILLETIFENQYLTMCKEHFHTKAYSDFKLICSDATEFPVHRFILSAFSPVMKAMFDTDMTEAKHGIAYIEDINGETMLEILRFIYTQEVRNMKDLAVSLLYGAEKYDLKKLKHLCADSMKKNFSRHNAIEYLFVAEQYNLKDLFNHAVKYIKYNYKLLSHVNKDWKTTDKRRLLELLGFRQDPAHLQTFKTTIRSKRNVKQG